LHLARPHPGQQAFASRVRALLEGSTLIDSAGRVQDAYSLRCAPQVIGPALDTLNFVGTLIEREINSATDNPLLFAEESGQIRALSGGNFHGEPVGMALDYLKIALAEVGAISERRTARLIDGRLNDGLPPMLASSVEAAGLNSGLMMPHYTAAALVLENQGLAAPDSVRSLPTSANQEDHNANATNAARHARQVLANVQRILAVELLTAAQAVDLRLRLTPHARLGQGTARLHALIRAQVPFIERDQLYGPALMTLTQLIAAGELD
jgi:histidine ammonia-lyase